MTNFNSADAEDEVDFMLSEAVRELVGGQAVFIQTA